MITKDRVLCDRCQVPIKTANDLAITFSQPHIYHYHRDCYKETIFDGPYAGKLIDHKALRWEAREGIYGGGFLMIVTVPLLIIQFLKFLLGEHADIPTITALFALVIAPLAAWRFRAGLRLRHKTKELERMLPRSADFGVGDSQ